MTKPYDIEEHRHRFAVWAAARAAMRGFTNVENLRDALEKCGVREFLASCEVESVEKTAFEKLHSEWCHKVMARLTEAKIENVTFGRAAKLIAIYLKVVVVIAGKHESALARVAYPPIDSILLAGAAKEPKAALNKIKWARTRWTKLDEEGYYGLISELRAIAPDEPFWMLERYWTVTDEKGPSA